MGSFHFLTILLKKSKLCVLRRPNCTGYLSTLPIHLWDAMSQHCQWKNKCFTSSLSVALGHTESRFKTILCWRLQMGNLSKTADSAWQSSTQEAHISSQRLKLVWGGLDQAYSQEHKKIFHVEGIRFIITTSPFPGSLTCTESIKCLWLHVPEVTFRLLFVTLSCRMPLSAFPIPCIYVTEVVKQKCSESCWPWPLTP